MEKLSNNATVLLAVVPSNSTWLDLNFFLPLISILLSILIKINLLMLNDKNFKLMLQRF